MSNPAFIFKRRTIELGAKNPYRPRGQIKYGPWLTVRHFHDLDAALDFQRADHTGLYDRAVFFKGRAITDSQGRLSLRMRVMLDAAKAVEQWARCCRV